MGNRKSAARLALLALLAALSILFSAGATAQSPPPDAPQRLDPDTTVTRDGRVLPPPRRTGAPSRIEPARRGTGELKEETATDKPVPPAPPPGNEVGIASIIGDDDRVQVLDTTTFPWSAITYITFTATDGNNYFCTGWLISDDTVATAGHCLHGGPGTGWFSNVRVYPGRNGDYLPYGSCGEVNLYSVLGWTNYGDEEYDYGAIKLDCTVGAQAGWFGFSYTSSSLTGTTSFLDGYPGMPKPTATMWASRDQIRVSDVRLLFYANDTDQGQSGAPVWKDTRTYGPLAMAIHTNGLHSPFPPGYHDNYNHGTRVTESVYNNLVYWRNL